MNVMKNLFIQSLRRLTVLPAPSWRERRVAEEFARLLGLEWKIDKFGNVIAELTGDMPVNVCLAAHMDQVFFEFNGDSLFVSKPWLWHSPSGEWYEEELMEFIESGQERIKTLQSNKVLKVRGCMLCKDFVKIEVEDNRSLKELIPGELAVNLPSLRVIKGDLLVGSPLDDRVGLAALIYLAQHFKLKPAHERPSLTFLGTVAEEVGNRSEIDEIKNMKKLKCSILIDSYCPLLKGVDLGKGPVVGYYKKTCNHESFSILCQMQNTYPLQIRRHKKDYISNLKYPVGNRELAVISFPLRRIHTSAEVISLKDVENLLNVAIHLVEQLSKRQDL